MNASRLSAVPLRSWLCAPAFHSGLATNALASAADIIHYDLEDSVPANMKQAAREALTTVTSVGAAPTAARVNQLRTTDGLRDLLFLVDNWIRIDIIILPKAHLHADIQLVTSIFARDAVPAVFIVVETARTLCELRNMTAIDPSVQGLIFGAADFAADLGLDPRTAELSSIKQEVVLHGRRLGLYAIDSPCLSFADLGSLQRELLEAQRAGFDGKIAIHPSQVPLINNAFTPRPYTVFEAREIINGAAADSRSTRAVDGQMYGPPHLKFASHILRHVAVDREPLFVE